MYLATDQQINPVIEIVQNPTDSVLTVDEVVYHCKLDVPSEDTKKYLEFVIKSAVLICEKHTWLTLLNTEYSMYLDWFESVMTMRKSPFASIQDVQTLKKDGIWESIDKKLYYTTRDKPYSNVIINYDICEDLNFKIEDERKECIKISFTAGFGETREEVPHDLRFAILNHIAYLYRYRGDYGLLMDVASDKIPENTRKIYDQYSIGLLSMRHFAFR